MWNSFLSLFNKFSLDEKLEILKPKATNIIYRDELISKKPSPNKTKKVRFFEASEPLLLNKEEEEVKLRGPGVISCGVSGEQKGARIRIKVKMTREEAVRMLSKCKDGGVLEFKDLASELVQIPSNRVIVLPPSSDV